ncbi:hypothetical protein PybrP1_001421 [[Pythium] brassicae (nom. inval.)]|nr:hypothetical protein PybrP1_001421 [[Pythium] brassicae (nom. inval.)]
MAGDGDKKPWESAAGAVSDTLEGASKSVRDVTTGGVNQVKSLVGANVGQAKEQAKELTSAARIAIRRVGQQALNGIKDAVRPVVQVFEKAESKDGTQLRRQISSARVQLNEQLSTAQLKIQESQKATDEQLVPVRAALADAQTQLVKVNAFRREHPEAAVAGLVAVVGLPSLLLRGKIAAARNVLVAVGGGAAVAYGSDRLAAKKK